MTQVLVWDDMARQTSVDKFKKTGIADLGKPHYHLKKIISRIAKFLPEFSRCNTRVSSQV